MFDKVSHLVYIRPFSQNLEFKRLTMQFKIARIVEYCNFSPFFIQYKCCGSNSHTNYVDLTTAWTASYVIAGEIVEPVVPPTCCKQEAGSEYPGQVEFKGLEECMVQGDVDFIHAQVRS